MKMKIFKSLLRKVSRTKNFSIYPKNKSPKYHGHHTFIGIFSKKNWKSMKIQSERSISTCFRIQFFFEFSPSLKTFQPTRDPKNVPIVFVSTIFPSSMNPRKLFRESFRSWKYIMKIRKFEKDIQWTNFQYQVKKNSPKNNDFGSSFRGRKKENQNFLKVF